MSAALHARACAHCGASFRPGRGSTRKSDQVTQHARHCSRACADAAIALEIEALPAGPHHADRVLPAGVLRCGHALRSLGEDGMCGECAR